MPTKQTNMTNNLINSKEQYIKRLSKLCKQAMCEGNIKCALEAEKMIGSACGYFKPKSKHILDINEMGDEDIDSLIMQLREKNSSRATSNSDK